MPLSALLFIMISSFLVIPNLISGWSRNSKYSLIGSLRGVAQTISYEAVITTLIVILLVLTRGYSITTIKERWNLIILFFIPVWLICVLAEGHRAPFDFREAESELVSGYNTEYAGVNFAFLFLAEYSVLLFSRMLTALVFFNQIHPVRLTLTGLRVAFLIT
jgi:NADH:ubiquinone oxidoreductase subunit H